MAMVDRIGPETLQTQRFGSEVFDGQHGAFPCSSFRQTSGCGHSVTGSFYLG
jgi:hypothetical protein